MRVLAISLLVLAAACAGNGPGTSSKATPELGPMPAITTGQPLPDASLPFIDGDGELATADLRGQPTVLNFWASWCAFCVDEMPDIQAVHEELGDEVRFIGIDREDDHDKALMLARGTGVTYELVVDDDSSFFRAVQARGMPATIVVDADGVIVARHTGPIDAVGLRALIDQSLPDLATNGARTR